MVLILYIHIHTSTDLVHACLYAHIPYMYLKCAYVYMFRDEKLYDYFYN